MVFVHPTEGSKKASSGAPCCEKWGESTHAPRTYCRRLRLEHGVQRVAMGMMEVQERIRREGYHPEHHPEHRRMEPCGGKIKCRGSPVVRQWNYVVKVV
jgi:hypothetical protein